MGLRTGRVTGRQTAKNKDGSQAVRLLQVVVTDKDDVQTVQLGGQAGEECNPPNGSIVALLPAGPALKIAVVSLDAVTPVMDPGGKRIYSTDSVGTTVKAQFRLDPDGTITVSNDNASFTMTPSGEFQFSGTLASFDCPVTMPEATINGVTESTHVHSDPQGGVVGGPVNP